MTDLGALQSEATLGFAQAREDRAEGFAPALENIEICCPILPEERQRMMKSAQTESFWTAYSIGAVRPPADYDVVAFDDNPSAATELAELVIAGVKRATASLARDFEGGKATLPHVGAHVVVIDGVGVPRCIWRTTEVRIGPMSSVDASFAWEEGEGDRTRDWWLETHRRYFGRQAQREGFDLHDDMAVVFERFEVVWPPDLADRP